MGKFKKEMWEWLGFLPFLIAVFLFIYSMREACCSCEPLDPKMIVIGAIIGLVLAYLLSKWINFCYEKAWEEKSRWEYGNTERRA